MAHPRTVVHERIGVVRHVYMVVDRSLGELALVRPEVLIEDIDELVTVRSLLFMPQSESVPDLMYRSSELQNKTHPTLMFTLRIVYMKIGKNQCIGKRVEGWIDIYNTE